MLVNCSFGMAVQEARALIYNVLGLPQKLKNKLENIHFLCCSNKVDALTLAKPIVENLLKLENGVCMFDALSGKKVLVLAPVIFIMADNPMCSDLCNHQGSTANKFCRVCMVKKK